MSDTLPPETLRAVVPWFGAKRRLAPEIVAELGDHQAYWEPFCGSLAVVLAKQPCPMETVGDLHGDLCNLLWTVQDPTLGPKLYRRLRRVPMTEALFDEAADRLDDDPVLADCPDLQRAIDYFLVSWQGRNGTIGTTSSNTSFSARYTRNGGHAGQRWTMAVRSIPQWRRRLRHLTILHRDAFDTLDRIEDQAGTVIYCDPPYLVKGARYAIDFEPDDHRRLAEKLSRFKHARVVVSYYDEPQLDELYPRWTKRLFDVSKSLAHTDHRGHATNRASESLLINGPSFVQSPGLFGASS